MDTRREERRSGTLRQQTRQTRDSTTNQVMEIRDPLNRVTHYTYDAAGNVTSTIDPQGNPTLFDAN